MKFFRFGKRQINDNLPEEVKTFTVEEQRERMGIAWMVGITSLLVVLLITAGLFFGGRWAYNKIANKDTKSATSSTKTTKQKEEAKKDQTKKDDTTKTTTPTKPTPTTPVIQNPAPVTGPTDPSLPRTGPDSDE